MKKTRVAIVVFDGVEVLDFCGPFEVFSITRLDGEAPFEVTLTAETVRPVIATGGLKVIPDFPWSECPPPEILLVPGGMGTRREMHNPAMLEFVSTLARQAELVCSVCTGALILGKAGLLEGKRITTHRQALELLRETCPGSAVDDSGVRFLEEGSVITSAGIAAGIDMALHVVSRRCGREVARETARHMEYPLSPSAGGEMEQQSGKNRIK